MDDRTKAIRLLIAGGIFLAAGLNFWRKGAFDVWFTGLLTGALILGGVACLGVGGYLIAQD
jgi:hypothetical protein